MRDFSDDEKDIVMLGLFKNSLRERLSNLKKELTDSRQSSEIEKIQKDIKNILSIAETLASHLIKPNLITQEGLKRVNELERIGHAKHEVEKRTMTNI